MWFYELFQLSEFKNRFQINLISIKIKDSDKWIMKINKSHKIMTSGIVCKISGILIDIRKLNKKY